MPWSQSGSGRVLGENLPELGDEPERVVVAALEDVAPEDQAGRAGFGRCCTTRPARSRSFTPGVSVLDALFAKPVGFF
jgi:hypothetical protein